MASVCIAPCYVRAFKAKYPSLVFTTVVGFPNGYQSLETKVFEAKEAINNGADEIDMVINLTHVSNTHWHLVEDELSALRQATIGKVLKVIIETASLSEEEVVELTKLVIKSKADYIKTSTGFFKAEDPYPKVMLMKETIIAHKSKLKIKVSGGIKTIEDANRYKDLDIERFGASRLLHDILKSQK